MNKLQRSLSDGNIWVFEAVYNRRSVTLDRGSIQLHHSAQGVERDIPDVVVLVVQESGQEAEGRSLLMSYFTTINNTMGFHSS